MGLAGVDTVSGFILHIGSPILTPAGQTTAAIQAFFMAMVCYPEVQRKARAELDAVVGPDRLPDFFDQKSLVYVNAIIKETLRWQNVVPFGGPHLTMKDDELHGFFIPARSMIIPNVW